MVKRTRKQRRTTRKARIAWVTPNLSYLASGAGRGRTVRARGHSKVSGRPGN